MEELQMLVKLQAKMQNSIEILEENISKEMDLNLEAMMEELKYKADQLEIVDQLIIIEKKLKKLELIVAKKVERGEEVNIEVKQKIQDEIENKKERLIKQLEQLQFDWDDGLRNARHLKYTSPITRLFNDYNIEESEQETELEQDVEKDKEKEAELEPESETNQVPESGYVTAYNTAINEGMLPYIISDNEMRLPIDFKLEKGLSGKLIQFLDFIKEHTKKMPVLHNFIGNTLITLEGAKIRKAQKRADAMGKYSSQVRYFDKAKLSRLGKSKLQYFDGQIAETSREKRRQALEYDVYAVDNFMRNPEEFEFNPNGNIGNTMKEEFLKQVNVDVPEIVYGIDNPRVIRKTKGKGENSR